MAESVRESISDFLAQKRIAMVGASRSPREFSYKLFHDLRKQGYDMVPVNPGAREIDGVACYDSVQAITPPVDAALLMTKPAVTDTVVKECAQAGIRRVWMYRATGQGAVSPAAVDFCRRSGIGVVPGFCPYMFLPGTGWIHRVHAGLLKIMRAYPA